MIDNKQIPTLLAMSFIALTTLSPGVSAGPLEQGTGPVEGSIPPPCDLAGPEVSPHCYKVFWSVEKLFWGIDYALDCIQYPSQCGSGATHPVA